MKKKMTIVVNWKMYLGFENTIDLVTKNLSLLQELSENTENFSLYLAPTLPVIFELNKILEKTKILLCAQDCSGHASGAYTGQVSAKTLKEIGCRACIIGHSECRSRFSDDIENKLLQLLNLNITPIICIGESEQVYRSQKTIQFIENQLLKSINILSENYEKTINLPIYIAYEPIWAIGTGLPAGRDHLESVFSWISDFVKKRATGVKIDLLYGGSVNSLNVNSLKKIENLHGFLIGKAGLNFQEFEKIVKCIMV